MKNNVRFDFITNTIIINKGYYTEACKLGTDEHNEFIQLQKDYPNMRIALRKSRPSSRKSDTKGLTYKYMRRFVAIMDPKNLQTFDKVQLHYELYETDNIVIYHHVKDWFLKTYPNHKDMIVNAEPQPLSYPEPQDMLRLGA